MSWFSTGAPDSDYYGTYLRPLIECQILISGPSLTTQLDGVCANPANWGGGQRHGHEHGPTRTFHGVVLWMWVVIGLSSEEIPLTYLLWFVSSRVDKWTGFVFGGGSVSLFPFP